MINAARAMVFGQDVAKRSLLWGAIALLLVWFFSLRGAVPLTYDEAWNFINLAEHGQRYVITHFPLPNNHVFFTFIQSLLPNAWVRSCPLLLRLPNAIIVVLFLGALPLIINRLEGPRWLQLALPLLFLGSSPIVTTYFFVARGYFLGSVLLFSSSVLFSRHHVLVGAVLLAAAGYCTPTFIFGAPGIFAFYFLYAIQARRRRFWINLVSSGFLFALIEALVYAPIAREVLANNKSFHIFETFPEFLHSLAQSMLAATEYTGIIWLAPLVWVPVLPIFWRSIRSMEEAHILTLVGLNCLFVAVSTLLVALGLFCTGLANLPFLRSISFVPFMSMAAMSFALATPGQGRLLRNITRGTAALLAVNACYGLCKFSSTFLLNDSQTFPYYEELSGTPLENAKRDGLDLENQKLLFPWRAEPTVLLYSSTLKYDLTMVDESQLSPQRCLVGRHLPNPGLRVIVEGRGAICY